MNQFDIQQILDVAITAGEEILNVYHDELKFNVVDFKADDSPLTLADQKSHDIIASKLERLYPDIPVLSEEGREIPYNIRKKWKEFWLVDPLDGTKEFIKRNGEFTVNIALIKQGYPVLGVIYAPVLDIAYYGQENEGAFKVERGNTIQLNSLIKKDENLVAVRSRSHASPEEEEIFEKISCD